MYFRELCVRGLPCALPCFEFHRVGFRQQKSPTRKWGSTPHPFSRRVPAQTAWEGVLTYGVSPITVAGPWPILTAFPASHACSLSGGSLCRGLRAVNLAARRLR